MEIISYESGRRDLWDEFCLKESECWFYHTSLWMEYCLNSRFSVQTRNFSYFIIGRNECDIMAVVPLILECEHNMFQFTYSGGPTPAPVINSLLSRKKRREVEQFIFSKYSKLAKDHSVQRIWLRQANQFQANKSVEPLLVRNGCIDTTNYTSVLALDRSLEELFVQVSQGKKELKKTIEMNYGFTVYDSENVTEGKFNEFKLSYFQAAGKVTRPETTFQILYSFVKKGLAYLFELTYESNVLGYVFIQCYKNYAYYAMSCRNKAVDFQFEMSSLHWEIIKYLKSKGILYYELGEQYFSPTFFYPVDQKMLTISRYKRGFGGVCVPQQSGEYFFSKEALVDTWNDRFNRYLENWEASNQNE